MPASAMFGLLGVVLLAFTAMVLLKKPKDQHRPLSPSWIVASVMSAIVGLGCLIGATALAL